MKIYIIYFDSEEFYLEAEGFGAAVKRWKIWMKSNYSQDYQEDWEPEGIMRAEGNIISTKEVNELIK